MKKFLCVILAIVMVLSFNVISFADNATLGEGVELGPKPGDVIQSVSGYASKFVSSSGDGSFNVYVTGSIGATAGLTFKTSCDESNSATSAITIQRPNSGYILHNAGFAANDEQYYHFLLPTPGTYKVSYICYVPSGATTQLQCWIY